MRRRVQLLFLLALLHAAPVFAAENPASPWLARSWQSDEGLPDNTIAGVAQIGGYLWVGTLGGLVSFDGARFREFPIVPIANVPNRVVRTMYVDSAERLWLGMDRGALTRLDRSEVKSFSTADGLPDLTMSVMAEDANGSLWIVYASGDGLAQIAKGKIQFHHEIESAPKGGPWWIVADREKTIWFAKGGSIGSLNEGKAMTIFNLGDPNARMAAARGNGVWVFANGELYCASKQGNDPEEKGRLTAGELQATALMEDRTGAVWIGTAARGLFRFDGGKFESMPGSHRSVTCLAEDSEGNIWVGTAGGGINRLRPRPVSLLNLQSGLPFESIQSICEDTSGALWMTTQNGALVKREGTSWATISSQPAWRAGHANCVAADPDGGVWIGTENHGLQHLKNGMLKSLSRKDGLASSFVRSILVGRRGELWVGLDSPNVLQRIQSGHIATFQPPQPARFLRAMAIDFSGRVWIGTAEGQLLYVDGEKLVAEPNTLQRPHSIRGLAATADGSIWVGYAGIGLGRVKDGQLHRISNAGGLLDSYISQIVADDQGRLWLGSNRGIFHVRISELEEFFDGKRDRVRSIAYGKGEGLPSLQASFDFFPGAFRSRDGSLWMPTRTGLALIRPDEIRDDPRPPKVLIENIAVDEKTAPPDEANPFVFRPLPWTKFLASPNALKIPPRHHKVDFDFTALSFTAPDNVHFRFKLDGVDPDWVEAGPVRHASYTLLPAGDYKFHVTASNHRGVWSHQAATLGFTVLPFYYQTWWFRGSMLLAFSILLVAAARVIFLRRVRTQMRALEQQAALHKERARIAKDIHDDLGANLTEIALLTELAQHDPSLPGRSGEYFDRIAGTARHVIKSLDEIVWAVNPRNDTLADFIDYTAQFALDHLRVADIRCRLDLPEVAPARELSADVRHNLFLATKEALHNVVKHSKATEAWLRVAVSNEGVRIVVEDNGCGFEFAPETATADGLRNMENRLREIGGALKVQSQLHRGSKVTFELPWPRK